MGARAHFSVSSEIGNDRWEPKWCQKRAIVDSETIKNMSKRGLEGRLREALTRAASREVELASLEGLREAFLGTACYVARLGQGRLPAGKLHT